MSLRGFVLVHAWREIIELTCLPEECSKCEQDLECQDDYASLKSGYWWKWRNETSKFRYKTFINNLLQSLPALGKDDV